MRGRVQCSCFTSPTVVTLATLPILLKLQNDLREIRSEREAVGFSCAHRFGWDRSEHPVTYSRILDHSTNIYISPINIQTGVFTASVSGTYSVSFSFYTSDEAEDGSNDVYLYRNKTIVKETLTPSETAAIDKGRVMGKVFQTSGRNLFLQLNVNETLSLGCNDCHKIWRLNFCVALLRKSTSSLDHR